MDCAGECNGSAELDACGVCDGGETDSNNCFDTDTIWIDWNANGDLDVYMYNESPVAGFQFSLTNVTIAGASGGSAEANGFNVSTSAATVLGFSLTGATIEAGSGLLTSVSFDVNDGEFQTCLDTVVMSDASGSALDFDLGDCETVVSLSGCTDVNACNYSEFANEDDGSCQYPEDLGWCDCDGSVEDCLGECGGDAVVDCNGDCDGGAIEDLSLIHI